MIKQSDKTKLWDRYDNVINYYILHLQYILWNLYHLKELVVGRYRR